jgi:hypothetical protein
MALGLLATCLISIVKYASDKAANNKLFKYFAIFILSACGAFYSEIWDDGLFTTSSFIGSFISIVCFSIGGYQTIGKAAKGLLQKYVPKKDDEDELVQTETC